MESEDCHDSEPAVLQPMKTINLSSKGQRIDHHNQDVNILISGIQGLGVEIAKNIIVDALGVKCITLHDEGSVDLWDLSSSFVFDENDLGNNRAVVCSLKLQQRRSDVAVTFNTTKLTKEELSDFQVVILTNSCLDEAMEFDEYCHNHHPPISFIKSEVRGLFGNVFCDFGPAYKFSEPLNQAFHLGRIIKISNSNPMRVSCIWSSIPEIGEGDLVCFSEVQGMVELNDGKPRKIKYFGSTELYIEVDATNYSPYLTGGTLTPIKVHEELQFRTLRSVLEDPGKHSIKGTDMSTDAKWLHIAFQALDMFMSESGRFPVPGSNEDVQEFMSLYNKASNELGMIRLSSVEMWHSFPSGARAVISPMATIFGGIVAEEAIKAYTRNFHPIYQFFYFHAVESRPSARDLKPLNSRYDAQISVFGSKLQRKLEDANVFIIGSDAVGHELVKNLALMGACSSGQGKLIITDPNILTGGHKTEKLAGFGASINSSLRVEPLEYLALSTNSKSFNSSSWRSMNVVITASNYGEVKSFVDDRCSYFKKPYLDSITKRSFTQTKVVVPGKIENNVSLASDISLFPESEQCFLWAQQTCKYWFEILPHRVYSYVESAPEFETSSFENELDSELFIRMIDFISKERCDTFEDCITWARTRFEEWFAVPELPRPLKFSTRDGVQLWLVRNLSILKAKMHGIATPDWVNTSQLSNKMRCNFTIEANSSGISDRANMSPAELAHELYICRRKLPRSFTITSFFFSTRGHIHLVSELANMRARTQGFSETGVAEVKNRIQMGETSSMSVSSITAGLLCLEFYKLIGEALPHKHRNSWVEIKAPIFSSIHPPLRKPERKRRNYYL